MFVTLIDSLSNKKQTQWVRQFGTFPSLKALYLVEHMDIPPCLMSIYTYGFQTQAVQKTGKKKDSRFLRSNRSLTEVEL